MDQTQCVNHRIKHHKLTLRSPSRPSKLHEVALCAGVLLPTPLVMFFDDLFTLSAINKLLDHSHGLGDVSLPTASTATATATATGVTFPHYATTTLTVNKTLC